ncbi:hypothetical protein ACFOWM_04280 [Ferruginibacter yonginensis]|uniref:Uncharacterized protein n=1 Tax=Ferruginibacter yonginensis TaxID=1310416 RepID=A0ABV8QQI9_9BACT
MKTSIPYNDLRLLHIDVLIFHEGIFIGVGKANCNAIWEIDVWIKTDDPIFNKWKTPYLDLLIDDFIPVYEKINQSITICTLDMVFFETTFVALNSGFEAISFLLTAHNLTIVEQQYMLNNLLQ